MFGISFLMNENVNEETNGAAADSSETTNARRPRLLFADDHHIILDALTFIASPQYEVRSVDNLKAFDEVFEEYSPDLVILDVRMPDGDGFAVAERLLQEHRDLKLMFLSMHTEPRYVKRAMETGAHAYISKRAPTEELMLAIRTVLDGGKYISSHLDGTDESWPGEEKLTERQLEVLRLISQGLSAKEIATKLEISVRTAEFHRAAIMDRLKLHSTAMMTRYAVERGLA